MNTQVIPFESAALPAFMQEDVGQGNLAAFSSGGFPVMSIKGKVFTLNKGGEKVLLRKPGSEDGEPASNIEVVILGIGPKGRESARIFYQGKFEEGSTEKPDCYSDDGITPAADAQNAQSRKCATCPQNVKGSGATPSNPTGKACSSAKRLAIATVDAMDDPILLRVPGASIVPLGDFLTMVKNRNVPNSYGVVTRIGFDYTVAYPALTFKPVGFVNAAQYAQAKDAAGSDTVKRILGETPKPMSNADEFDTPDPVAAPAKAAKAIPAPVEEELPPPKTKVLMEGEAPAPKAAKASKAKAAPVKEEPEVMPVDSGLSATLDDLDFDDE